MGGKRVGTGEKRIGTTVGYVCYVLRSSVSYCAVRRFKCLPENGYLRHDRTGPSGVRQR